MGIEGLVLSAGQETSGISPCSLGTTRSLQRGQKKHLGEPVWPRLAGQGEILVE